MCLSRHAHPLFGINRTPNTMWSFGNIPESGRTATLTGFLAHDPLPGLAPDR
jgi:hypothetical protein